jgi:dolichyl-phosphate-mannose-protein mannosyltransferase
MTGLATPGMIAIESFAAISFLKRGIPFMDLIRVLIFAFCTYTFYFAEHFRIGRTTADGDAFMPYEFQRTIIGNQYYDPTLPAVTLYDGRLGFGSKPNFWETYFYLNAEMIRANARIEQRHAWESYWYEWPINARGILYYSQDAGFGYTSSVYLLGNPVVIWMNSVLLVLIVIAGILFLRFRTETSMHLAKFTPFFTRIGYCIVTYICNMAPYVFVARSAFIYHYMPALMYAHIMVALFLDKLAGPKYVPYVVGVLSIAIIASFFFYAPWVYALPLTSEGHARRRWMKRWD